MWLKVGCNYLYEEKKEERQGKRISCWIPRYW